MLKRKNDGRESREEREMTQREELEFITCLALLTGKLGKGCTILVNGLQQEVGGTTPNVVQFELVVYLELHTGDKRTLKKVSAFKKFVDADFLLDPG